VFVGLGIEEGVPHDWKFGEEEGLVDIENLFTGREQLAPATS
jgi:hypothetical protein